MARAVHDAHAKLQAFRAMHGFGRAISAPQCNHHLRIVAMDLKGETAGNVPVDMGDGDGASATTFTLFNPEIVAESTGDMISLWDDCMSFPGLMVRVRRHRTISVEFDAVVGARVKRVQWENLPVHLSELVQHELDHLDGVLAVDRAEDDEQDNIVTREEWLARREEMLALVDYEIVPTV